jgi:hypothetical protein
MTRKALTALCLALPLAPWPGLALVGLGVLWLATPGWGRRA